MKQVASVIAVILTTTAGAVAHHSGSEYDRTTVEIEGTLVELVWQTR